MITIITGFVKGLTEVSKFGKIRYYNLPENPLKSSMNDNHAPQSLSDPKGLVIKFWSLFWAVAWVVLIVLLILRIFVFQQVNVVGSSMEPNYHTDERLVINRRNKELYRGQVVAAYSDPLVAKNATPLTPYDPATRFFLKRVIGLPGESIEVVGSQVVIYNEQFPDGRILDEPYIDESVKQREDILKEYVPKTLIPDGYYYLLGDNRANSQDSRNPDVGPFPAYSIFGQETFRYWPLDKASLFEIPEYRYIEIDKQFEQRRGELKSPAIQPVVKQTI